MFQNINENIAIGSIIDTDKLKEIKSTGYDTLIDLCSIPEGNKLDHNSMEDLGFQYINIPISPQTLNQETLKAFKKAVNDSPSKVYVRCASALRAGVFTLLTIADQEGWTEEKWLEEFNKLGLPEKQIILDFAHSCFVN